MEAQWFADAHYSGIELVSKYASSKVPMVQGVLVRPHLEHRDSCIRGLFYRTTAWLDTLAVLNKVGHFQAISTANRALLELAVDLFLLHADSTNESGWKMYCWGLSERMKSAESVVEYFRSKGCAVPDEYRVMQEAYSQDKPTVDDLRLRLWPDRNGRPRHPRRWTGHENLYDDVVAVDSKFKLILERDMGSSLAEYYRTEYRQMNWNIHSGLAGVWNLSTDTLHATCGIAFKGSADLGMLCTKVVLTDLGFLEVVDDLHQQWEALKLRRGLA